MLGRAAQGIVPMHCRRIREVGRADGAGVPTDRPHRATAIVEELHGRAGHACPAGLV